MPRYEGILVTWNGHVNTSAAGALIENGSIELDIYHPSDSSRYLKENSEFTFSLVDDPALFFKAALTGVNKPGFQEISEEAMDRYFGFFYPKKASVIHLCKVKEIFEYKVEDKYGESVVSKIKGNVIKKFGDGEFIQRENPLVDALVYATRVSLVEGEQREKLKEKIYKCLETQEDETAKKILNYIEGY